MREEVKDPSPPAHLFQRQTVIRITLIAVIYFLAHQVSFVYPDTDKVLMAIWPAGGIGLATLLLSPRALWPAILISLFVAGDTANLLAGRPPLASAGFMTANVLESATCAWVIRRLCGEHVGFARVRHVLALALAAILVNTCTALIGAASATLTARMPFWSFWKTWCIAHGLGILLVTPLIVTWSDWRSTFRNTSWGRILEGVAFLAVLGTVARLTFDIRVPNNFALEPYTLFALLAWGALRLGQRGVATASVTLAAIVITSSTVTAGPLCWGGETLTERLLLAQTYLGVTTITSLLLAAAYAERAHMEQTLVEERNLLASVVEGTRVGTWRWNVQTGETEFNERWAEIVGHTLEELAPISIQTWVNIVHPDDLKKSDAMLQDHFAGRTDYYDVECRMRHKNGSWVWVHDRGKVAEWAADGKPLIMAGTHTDITHRKHAENELARYRLTLEDMVREKTEELLSVNAHLRKEIADRKGMEAALQAHRAELAHVSRVSMLGELTSGLAHEINQPLGAISNYASSGIQKLRSKSQAADTLSETFERIVAQARRAGEVIDHIRRFVNREVPSRSLADVNQIVQDAVRFAEYGGTLEGSGVEIALTQGLPSVMVNVVQIEQVIVNLLCNAIEATRLNVSPAIPPRIATFKGNSGKVVVAVSDRGPGIDPAVAGRVFEPFFTTKPGGMGMGLPISRTIVEDHEGTIWIESNPQGGAMVSFCLPVVKGIDNE